MDSSLKECHFLNMATKPSATIAVLTSVVDTLKQQVHSALDVFCTEALRSSLELSGQGLEMAIVTLSTVLHQLKDKGELASSNADLSVTKLSSTPSTLITSAVDLTAVGDESNNVLLSRINKLERSMLEVMQKGEQTEQRQKVLDETWTTKKELCDLQDQLTSRMFTLEYSLKGLDSEVKSRLVEMSEELGGNNQRLQDVERSQLDTSESMGQELNMVKLTIKELDKKMVDVNGAVSSIEADVYVLTDSVSQVQGKMSDIEKKVSRVGNRMSDAELKTSDIQEKLIKTKLTSKNQMKILNIKTDQLTHIIEKKVDNLESLKAVLNQLKDRTMERAALSTKVDQMEQNLSHLSQCVRKQHHTTTTRPVATASKPSAQKATDDNVGNLSKLMINAATKVTKDFFQSQRD